MDSQLIQRTRYQLQTRVRTAKTCPPALFPQGVKHLIEWIEQHPLLRHLIDPLREKIAVFDERIATDLAKAKTPAMKDLSGPWDTADRDEAVALSWSVLKALSAMELSERNTRSVYLLALFLTGFESVQRASDLADAVRDVGVQAVYDFLDEQIDSRNVVIGLLHKYKTRCEWYRRDRLRDAAVNGLEGRKGERALAFDLYEYLDDQGVDFAIESATASGEPDLLASEASGQPLVADAKYVVEDAKLADTLASGFRQVRSYCSDKNEPVGYLVVFLNCGVSPDLKADRDDGFPCFRLGGISVYYVVVDIRERTKTASKLPKPRVVEIPHERLVTMVSGEPPADLTPIESAG